MNENDTRQPISLEDKGLLLESIEAAEGPGACEYVVHGRMGKRPGCVVGQFAYRKGVSLVDLEANEGVVGDCLGTELYSKKFISELADFPSDILRKLQVIWDRPTTESASDRREEMRRIVHNWPTLEG